MYGLLNTPNIYEEMLHNRKETKEILLRMQTTTDKKTTKYKKANHNETKRNCRDAK